MRVLLFAHLKQLTGPEHLDLPSTGPLTVEVFWARLLDQFPALASQRPHLRLARNWEYAQPGDCFEPTDELALIPPVSGG
jgi:molybdopterin converting factor small subunit